MNTESNNPLQPGTMSNSLIQTLIDNYRQNHLSAINNTLGIQDAHSIWFDLPKLKNFIAKIEEEAAKVDPATSEGDLGIRFYYASYPKQENWSIMDSHPVPEEYAEKHTLVMIPTLKKADEAGELIDYDFNPFQSSEGKSMALNARSVKAIGGGEDDDDDKGLGENSGTLIPPSPPLGISY
ncbi:MULTISPECIES: hypothetical protein [Chryseobacterium]|uniref:hypothetical protein n=1 Tax=Chryseobacterium TaxID=59732 RepID=UPI000E74AD4E|nr:MULTISPECIES: hypothetical protein [Chryseobacterium]MDH5036605.1 hypothetical protein [Chryseobacterium cucumeris]QWT84238.1 hypothetical protein KBP46_11885 [Chryseobacterium sp. PCH239]RKE71912.1 hypothetical protein DEU39_4885 [Chryseobacterium sp. AG363]